MNEPVLYLIIPCYNEEKVIQMTAARVTEILNNYIEAGLVSAKSRICLIDDGSTDRTWKILLQLYKTNDKVVVLRHNRNYGEQYAYLTGIRFAASHADCMITMDADLQDDVRATDAMLNEYFCGKDIAYGVRRSRNEDHPSQKWTSNLFYRFMRLCGTELVSEHSQYRMMSRRAAKEIIEHMELKVFLPAMIPLLGLPYSIVYYDRRTRAAGESHYNVRSLARMASNAILSYGVRLPLFLVLCCILDCVVAILAALSCYVDPNSGVPKAVLLICLGGAVVFGILFYYAKKEMNRHLRAKKRPCSQKQKE